MQPQHGQYFDVHSPRFKCCCGSVHVKQGAMIIAVLMAFGLIVNLIRDVITYSTVNGSPPVVGIVGVVLGGIICISLFHGIRIERASFLVPFLVVQGLSIVLLLIGSIICIIGIVSDVQFARNFADSMYGTKYCYNSNSHHEGCDDYNPKFVAGMVLLSFLITMALEVWFFWVVYKCYVFFREQFVFCQAHTNTVGYSTQMPGYTIQTTAVNPPGYAPQPQPGYGYNPQLLQPGYGYSPQPPPGYVPQQKLNYNSQAQNAGVFVHENMN